MPCSNLAHTLSVPNVQLPPWLLEVICIVFYRGKAGTLLPFQLSTFFDLYDRVHTVTPNMPTMITYGRKASKGTPMVEEPAHKTQDTGRARLWIEAFCLGDGPQFVKLSIAALPTGT